MNADEVSMSNGEVILALLGEQMKAMQSDIRRVDAELIVIREKVIRFESEQVELRDTIFTATGELTVRMGRLERRMERLEQRLDGLEASMDARFRQVHETMATNMQVLLTAIQGRGTPN